MLRDHVDVPETHHVSAILNIDQVLGPPVVRADNGNVPSLCDQPAFMQGAPALVIFSFLNNIVHVFPPFASVKMGSHKDIKEHCRYKAMPT